MSRRDFAADTDQTRIVQAYFDEASSVWARRYERRPRRMSDLDLQLRRENARQLLHELIAAADRPLQVLDVGCGPGGLLDGFSREAVTVHGVDVSPEMVAAAARRHPSDVYVLADAEALPFDTDSMDVVASLGVLEYVPDPQGVLVAMHRVLRPGGHLIVSFPNRISLLRRLSRVETAAERLAIGALRMVRGRAPLGDGAPPYHHQRWSPKEAHRLLESAGFVVEQVLYNTFGLWGRLGRLRPSLALSAWLSRRLGRRSLVCSRLAHTMVVHARTRSRR